MSVAFLPFFWSMITASTAAAYASDCKVAALKTADKTVALRVDAVAGACAGFFVGDAAALEVTLTPATGTEVTDVELIRADGLPAAAAPTVRSLSKGRYFLDNLAFSAPGNWTVAMTLQRGSRAERVDVALPVQLTPRQLAQTTSNTALVPAFALSDPTGRKVTNDTLRGKVWVASAFFARCPDVCPLLEQKLAALQRQFRGAPDFRTVSVTTDPVADTKEVLAAFAKRYGADPDRWFFLTGDKAAIVALAGDSLKLDVSLASAGHSSRFVVVDRVGHIKGTYDTAKVEEFEQLKIVIGTLLGDSG